MAVTTAVLRTLTALCMLIGIVTGKGFSSFKQVTVIKTVADYAETTGQDLSVIIAITKDEDTFEGGAELAKELEAMCRVTVINSEKSGELIDKKKLKGPWMAKAHGKNSEMKSYATLEEAKQVAVDSIPKLVQTLTNYPAIEKFLQTSIADRKLPLLLYHDKDEDVPQLLVKVSLYTEEHITIAAVPRPDAQVLKALQVEEMPTIMVMVPQEQADGRVGFSGFKYDKANFGKLKFKNVIRFCSQVIQEMQKKGFFPTPEQAEELKKQKGDTQKQSNVKKVVQKPLFEYTADTPEACSAGQNGLCVFTIVDGSPLNEGKSEQLDVITQVQNISYLKDRVINYMWVDLTCHPSFGEFFGIRPENLPALVVVSPRKKAFAQHVGAFEKKKVSKFISGVLGGQFRIGKLPGDADQVPVISAEEDCAAIHQDMMPIEEDDLDMDDILSEIRAEEKVEAEKKAVEDEAMVDAEMAEKIAKAQREADKMNKLSNKKKGTKKKKKKTKKKKSSKQSKEEL